MALFNDLAKAAQGAVGVLAGTQQLGQGTIAGRNLAPPSPSPAELSQIQLAQAIQLANLQQAGYNTSRDASGNLTLTPTDTVESRLLQALGPGIGAGLQRELGGMGSPSTTPLGQQLNASALAGSTGRSQINRQALIEAINRKRGGGQAASQFGAMPQPTAITQPLLSSEASFANVPSLQSLARQQAGPLSSLQRTVPLIAGITGGLGLASKLGLGDALRGLIGGPSAGGSITASDLFGFPATSAEQEAIGNAGSGMGSFDFSSLANVPDPNEWTWVPDLGSDTFSNFADLGFGLDLNP